MNAAPIELDLVGVDAMRSERLLPALGRIREHDPVFWSERNRGWIVTRHEDVLQGFQDTRLSNVRILGYLQHVRERWPDRIPNLLAYLPGWVFNNDGQTHARLRKLLVQALSRKYVESLRPAIRERALGLTRKAIDLGECDFVSQIAFPLPATTILIMLGIPLQHLEKIQKWNSRIVIALSTPNPDLDTVVAAEQAIAEMNEMVGEEIAARREAPRDDFLTALMNASAEGDRLSQAEMLGICHVMLTAGHETTVNSMVTGLVAWAGNPRQRELYLEGAVDGMAAISEMMRYSGMSTLQRKIVLEPFDWHGRRLGRGDVVYLFVAAANRDPRVFADPDVMDVTRANLDKVLTFGPGIHHCVGHHLAKLQLDEFFRVFLPSFGHVEILDQPLAQLPGMTFRGLGQLRVRLVAAPAAEAGRPGRINQVGNLSYTGALDS